MAHLKKQGCSRQKTTKVGTMTILTKLIKIQESRDNDPIPVPLSPCFHFENLINSKFKLLRKQ